MLTLADLNIAVFEGGPGSEREVSLRSSVNVAGWLREAGARCVTTVDVRDEHFDLPAGTNLVFNCIHGTFGEDGGVQAVLDARGIHYTGEGQAGSRLAFDKVSSKKRFTEHGVPTPEYEVIRVGQRPSLPLPIVIKATREGSSVGVCLVHREEEISPALEEVAKYGDEILIERLISGHELTVGVVGDLALPIIMIKPREGFYDFKNKYPWSNPAGAADHFCPAPLPVDVTEKVQRIALAAHRALGLETYCRVDLLLDENDEPYVLEANTIPGMTESSLLPEAARAVGITPPQLCERIVQLSLARYR